MKRACILVVALVLAVALVGCVKPKAPEPTPAPPDIITPSELPVVPSPIVDPLPTDPGAVTPGNTVDDPLVIANFKDGEEVPVSDLPELTAALQKEFDGATINKITYSLQEERQLYRVDFTDKAGKEDFVYMAKDGAIIPITIPNETAAP